MQSFERLIKEKYDTLSPGQKKVAEYLIQKLDESAFNTAAMIGRKVDVSETTVIRLSYALGFNGFSEMQHVIQQQILTNSLHPFGADSENVHQDEEHSSPFSEILEKEILSQRQAFRQLNEKELWKVVEVLMKAEQIFILGMGASYAPAYWFSFQLHTLRERVTLCPTTGDIYERLVDLNENSVLFVISFPRYSKDALHIAESAKKQGVPLICVTDRLLSPVGRIADYTLTTEENSESMAHSITPAISLLDYIIAGITVKDRERIQARQQKLEALYTNYGVYVE
ncbi:transcriptional regulator [Neobacillus bataviensis LMG 21833]|uniref:Transcriptional regulator n=1 Tax=Neobacillus bataviensis LMG 21833 TaxID=1117379 RepID=K6D1P0_9BACI|nr:MurR/RpiR family transcriptional regulator [Neobacillus bataviensis]EKN66407.1 transcriptional regulator [Neobacillus bataviensis LMG 21833]